MPDGPSSSPSPLPWVPHLETKSPDAVKSRDPMEVLVAHVNPTVTVESDTAGPEELAVAIAHRSEHAKVLALPY